MLFSELEGQKGVKQQLVQSAQSGRIAHALLFLGPEGCGSLPLAIAYAQYVNCSSPGATDACGECPSCNKYKKLAHPDLHFVYPLATTKKVSNPVSDDYITEWRQALIENPYLGVNSWYGIVGLENKQGNIGKEESAAILKKLSLKNFEARYKVMIIWMAEKMNDSCANKILKILEEPPGDTLFLLIAESTEGILPTILSRTQIIKLPKLKLEDISSRLSKITDASGADINGIAHLANGNFSKAFELVQNEGHDLENQQRFIELMRIAYKKNVMEIVNWVDSMSSLGREKLKIFLEYALRMVRENYLLNLSLEEIVYLDKGEDEFSQKFHVFINGDNINKIVEELSEAHVHIERNGYNKIVLLDMSLKLFGLINPRK